MNFVVSIGKNNEILFLIFENKFISFRHRAISCMYLVAIVDAEKEKNRHNLGFQEPLDFFHVGFFEIFLYFFYATDCTDHNLVHRPPPLFPLWGCCYPPFFSCSSSGFFSAFFSSTFFFSLPPPSSTGPKISVERSPMVFVDSLRPLQRASNEPIQLK